MKPKRNLKEPAMDLCQTPAYALSPIAPYLSWFNAVWEPACGEKILASEIKKYVPIVYATDIISGTDFFEQTPEYFDAIVTNPPYSIKYDWLRRCYELGKSFALLMPVEMIGAKKAQVLFERHGIEIIYMDKRVNFKMPNKGYDGKGAQFPVAWYTWRFGIGMQISFAKIDRLKEN